MMASPQYFWHVDCYYIEVARFAISKETEHKTIKNNK